MRHEPLPSSARPKPKGVFFAKFPPDDDDLPGGPPAPGTPGAPTPPGASDDGDFKKGRMSPVAIAVGVLIALGAGAAIYFGVKSQGDLMTVAQVAAEKKNIFVLPGKEQLPKWRAWAADPRAAALQQEAIMQLAWADDPEGVALATKALTAVDHKVRGTAAQVLAYYGSPKADSAKPSLLQALKDADESDKPQIVWALATLKEASAFNDVMDLYRKGYLTKVERLGGGSAFDPEVLAGLVSLDELAKLATDPSAAVRQLVATVLSRNAEPKWTPVLVQLVKDKDSDVGREAANGLGRIADEASRGPLLQALGAAEGDNRQKFLEALRDGIGGEGLVLALDSVRTETEEKAWFQTKQIMDMLKELADPRAGDALEKWIENRKPSIHWEGEAGTRLAEIGDVRGAKHIGLRMRADPLKLYKLERFWEADKGGHLSRNDLPRIVGARMLADLAIMHPEARADLAAAAEDGVLAWLKDRPQPQANGLRYLAAVQSEKALKDMRDWSFPKKELPKEGQQGTFPMEFETAQSALRYIGMMKDEPSFPKLLEQFKKKKDKSMDITQEGLQGAGLTMLGMSLRALGYGAAQGLAQWGDARAVKPLQELIEDEKWHEEARQAACEALPWCADDKTMIAVAKKVKEFTSKKEPKKQVIGACYAASLAMRPVPSAVPELVELLTPELDLNTRLAIAHAIGVSGFDATVEGKLFEKLKNPELRNAAALALILGGSTETAARTIAQFGEDGWKEALDDLKDHYYRMFGYWSDLDFKNGNLYRWVANATAISHVRVGDAPQEWAVRRLQSQFDNLDIDNGPHSETRVVLRYRLFNAAKKGDLPAKKNAIETLKFMKEKGSLMALRHEKSETGDLAKKAFFELMHPKAFEPENLSALQQKTGDKKAAPPQAVSAEAEPGASAEQADDGPDDDAPAAAAPERPAVGRPNLFARVYMTVDTRTLGLFRVLFALLLLADLARHIPRVDEWFLEDGVVPAAALRANTELPLSFFFFLPERADVFCGMGACAVAFLGLLVGYRTRWFQFAALVCAVALHGRTDVVEHAGERVINLFAVYTLFLPLGRHFSIDALLAARRAGHADEPVAPLQHRSIAYFAILIQLVAIYLFDCLTKNGEHWKDGTAIYYALLEFTNTPLGSALRDELPLPVYQAMTWGTLVIEGSVPWLLMIPWRTLWLRRTAMGLTIALHVGIRLFMNLGVFQPVMAIVSVLLLAREDWEVLIAWMPVTGRLLRRARGRILARLPGGVASAAPARPFASQVFFLLGEAASTTFLAWMFVLILYSNEDVPLALRPKWAQEPSRAALRIGIFQSWKHYAPNPDGVGGILVVEAVTVDGRVVNPVAESSYGYRGPALQAIPPHLDLNLFWWNFEKGFLLPENRFLWFTLKDWILRYPKRTGRPEDQIVRFRVSLLRWRLPSPGRAERAPPQKLELYHYPRGAAANPIHLPR